MLLAPPFGQAKGDGWPWLTWASSYACMAAHFHTHTHLPPPSPPSLLPLQPPLWLTWASSSARTAAPSAHFKPRVTWPKKMEQLRWYLCAREACVQGEGGGCTRAIGLRACACAAVHAWQGRKLEAAIQARSAESATAGGVLCVCVLWACVFCR